MASSLNSQMANRCAPLKIEDSDAVPYVDQSAQEWEEIVRHYSTAAQDGDTETLYSLIARYPRALKQIQEIPFEETPLHIAASAGNVSVASELLILEPKLVQKLNKKGFTPLHLALQEMHKLKAASSGQRNEDPEMQGIPGANSTLRERLFKVVRVLIQFDKNLVKVKGKEGLTPLHYAAQMGDCDLLLLFLNVCPMSILELTNQMKNALQIALDHKKLEAFQLLKEWLKRGQVSMVNLKRWKLLHLPDENGENASSVEDKTDFSPVDYSRIKSMIREKVTRRTFADKVKEETRGSLLVVATLLITLSLQIVYSPPGGTWQGDSSCPANNTSGCFAMPSHRAGTAVMGPGPFLALVGFNFLSGVALYFLLLSLLPSDIYNPLWLVPFSGLVASFILSVFLAYPSSEALSLKFLFLVLLVILAAFLSPFFFLFHWPVFERAKKRIRKFFGCCHQPAPIRPDSPRVIL